MHYYAELMEHLERWMVNVERSTSFKFPAKYVKENWDVVSGFFASQLATTLDNSDHLQVLDLSNARLGTAAMLQIIDSLAGHNKLRLLQLSGNKLDSEAASAIARLLRSRASLQGLWLGNNHMTDQGLIVLSRALLKGASITVLGLSANRFMGDGPLALAAALRKGTGACRNPQLPQPNSTTILIPYTYLPAHSCVAIQK